MTDDTFTHTPDSPDAPVSETTTATADHAPQYGVGPFSVREVALLGVWIVAFVVSFFSISVVRFDSVWTSGISWILTIGVPTAAVFLLVLRRLSPQGIRRVGSLGIDQFASVAFSVSSIVWLQMIWETVAFASQTGQWVRTWVIWVSFFLMVAGVFLTVFAPFIAPFDEDFAGRDEVPAHRNARPIRPVVARPVSAPAPVAEADESAEDDRPAETYPVANDGFDPADPYASSVAAAQASEPGTAEDRNATGVIDVDDAEVDAVPADNAADADASVIESIEASGESADAGAVTDEPAEDAEAAAESDDEPAAAPARVQAFWALVPEERDVVDDLGLPLFRIGPTAWALVIEDRGDSFVVRHEDGRTGILHDVSGVTRG
ncbi:hypothetical protein [Microbacterium sp. C7(2022)]|uniref:hypothetical protein n=1 Tax=Microbacterium sp. C7(2022) TaxID=2992759 RepID=UPI00237BB80E|nr:hypothetical protein [Microbacterium sp. C7(2022)]MDE0546765.1 hypothetical protein [Microbacterium sp. C7(2022)]